MSAELTKIIAQYLAGELSETDRKIFEDRLQTNVELQQEVALQKSVMEAAKRSGIRTQVQNVSKSFHFNQILKWAGISTGIIVAIAALSVLAYQQFSKDEPADLSQFETLIEKVKKDELIHNLPSEFFAWNGTDTAMLSKNGILISIPETAFFLNGKPYKEAALIQFQEALDAATIVKSGLSTMSNDRLLETQGMFSFTAYSENGEKLTINPKTGVYVQVPVNEYKEGMQLFTGVEDKNGIINWVNPKPLAKIPVPIDMNDLNFYPPGYEDSLNKMKLRKDKKYRDSLYLSCEEIESGQHQGNSISLEKLEKKPSIPARKLTTEESKLIYNDNRPIDINMGFYEAFVVSYLKKTKSSDLFSFSDYYVNTYEGRIRLFEMATQKTEIASLLRAFLEEKGIEYELWAYTGSEVLSQKLLDREFDTYPYLPPSNVLAFWKPKFNNTILSTREFEKRMQAIHGTCNNKVLEVYTKNLNRSIRELDEQVVKMGYSNFSIFAAENVGALNPDNPHVKALSAFYENGIKELRKEVARNRDKEQRRKDRWDYKVSDERSKESIRTSNRENQAFGEEYNLNHKNVRKQLGRTLGMTIYTNAQISNIDRFVYETTLARKTGEFYDKETGKTARIQYNDFSFEVANANAGNYKQIYAYLFPSELNSYQRISGKNGKFDYPLNDAIIYDLAIVGISEKGYSYYQKTKFKEGKLGTVSLKHISEEKLNASIEQLNTNRISKPMRISDELEWLKTEQKNYVEQRNRQNQFIFNERIKKIVFPCYEPMVDSIYAVENENPFEFQ